MRVVIAPDAFGDTLGSAAVAAAIAEGWRRGAPGDDLVLVATAGGAPHEPIGLDGALDGTLDRALDGAGLAVTGEDSFDWQSLRGTLVTAVARAAAARGVPCLVLAGQVSVGRREAAAAGVDAAYAVADDPGGTDTSPADPAGSLAVLAERIARRWSR